MDDKELIKKVTKLILSGSLRRLERYVIPVEHTKELANVLKCVLDSEELDFALSTLVSKYSDIFYLYSIVTATNSYIIKYNGRLVFYDVGSEELM